MPERLWYSCRMQTASPPITRSLYGWEIQEAYQVFGQGLNYARVRIHECAHWPDRVYQLGARLQRRQVSPDVHNAVTIGDHCYFPVNLPRILQNPGDPEFYKLTWLIHELTHVWQYQHMGWGYLLKALNVQIQHGAGAYHFGGEDGLRLRGSSARLRDFNLEQQGDIARSYYERLRLGEDTGAWKHFIAEMRGGDSLQQA